MRLAIFTGLVVLVGICVVVSQVGQGQQRANEPVRNHPDGNAAGAGETTTEQDSNIPVEAKGNGQEEVRVFRLQHADAELLAETARQLFFDGTAANSIQVGIDQRTNSLVVRGETSSLQELEALLSRLDQPLAHRDPNSNQSRLGDPNTGRAVGKLQEAERQAAALAQQLRTRSGNIVKVETELTRNYDPDTAARAAVDRSALERRLREQVTAAFEARQQLQRGELQRLTAQLRRIEQAIESRERIKDKIIEHRVAELLNPELEWNPSVVPPAERMSRDRVKLDGVVTNVQQTNRATTVEISVGHEDGVRVGHRFHVFRDQTYVGQIVIQAVWPDRSAATVDRKTLQDTVRPGDRVADELPAEQGPATWPGPPSGALQLQVPHAVTQSGYRTDGLDVPPDAVQVAAQILFSGPQGATVMWHHTNLQGKTERVPAVLPVRLGCTTGDYTTFPINKIPEFEGLELTGCVEIASVDDTNRAFIEHNAIPIALSREDIEQAAAGNAITKVVYLPKPEFAEVAISGVESLVTTRLDPGVDPVEEAQRRGHILAVVRLGNRN